MVPAAIHHAPDAAGSPPGVATAAVADPPLLEPAFSVTIDAPAQFRGIVFHPDGTRAFVHVSDPAIDLWPLAVYYWPEILGSLAVLLTLPALWVIWQRARRPRRVGRVYCRRCNYELGPAGAEAKSVERKANIQAEPVAEAATPQRCPECGTETAKRRPIPGRRMRRRLATPVAWVLVTAAAYGAMHAASVPRQGPVSHKFSGMSRRAAQFAETMNLGPGKDWWGLVDRVLILDVSRGRITGQLAEQAGGPFLTMVGSADGHTLFLLRIDGSRTVAVDSRTGAREVLPKLPAECARIPAAGGRGAPDWLGEGLDQAYMTFSAVRALQPKLVALWKDAYASWMDVGLQDSRFGTSRFLGDARTSRENARWLVYDLKLTGPDLWCVHAGVLDADAKYTARFDVVDRLSFPRVAILGAPKPALVVNSQWAWNLSLASLADGTALPQVPLPRKELAGSTTLASPRGSRVLVFDSAGTAAVYDAGLQRWTATVESPPSATAPWYFLSTDGRFVAAARSLTSALKRPGAAPEPLTELTVWDLSRIPPAAGEPSRAGP